MLSFVGNVKALFKLNVENESMEKARRGANCKKRVHVTG